MLTSSGGRSMLTVAGKGVKFAKILLTSYVNVPYWPSTNYVYHYQSGDVLLLILRLMWTMGNGGLSKSNVHKLHISELSI